LRIDPASLDDDRKAALAANQQAIAIYAGHDMTDPTLAGRLAAVTLVLWGQVTASSTPTTGRAYAAATPTATYYPLHQSPRRRTATPATGLQPDPAWPELIALPR
jgi:hypothetical protein